mgnify:CR=1 FL=1
MLCVLMDLQKAFDTVEIELLLKKLNNMGFCGEFHDFSKSLIGRRQFTKTNGCMSGLTPVPVAVAQGSVLGS